MRKIRGLLARFLNLMALGLLLCSGQPTIAQTPVFVNQEGVHLMIEKGSTLGYWPRLSRLKRDPFDSRIGTHNQRVMLSSTKDRSNATGTHRGADTSVHALAETAVSTGAFAIADAPTVELVGQLGSALSSVAVVGDFAYLAVGPRLLILNIANPLDPAFVGQSSVLPGLVWDIEVSGNHAYVAEDHYGLHVIAVNNPASPVEVGCYDTPGSAMDVAFNAGYAYVADGVSGLRIINVSNPSIPVEVGYYDTPGDAKGVAVSGSTAYVADHYRGLRVINVSNPAAPVEVGFYDTPEYAEGVAVSGSTAYVADGDAGLRVIDISSPAAPFEVDFYDTAEFSEGVTVSGGLIYVADYYGGLYILRYGPFCTFLPLVLRDYVHYFEGTWEVEPNNTCLQANGPLISGLDYTGYPNDEKDYFSIYLRKPGPLTINLTDHTGQAVQLQLFYQGIDNRVAFDTAPPYTITYDGQPGWYYIYIYTGGGHNSTTPYTLRVTYLE